MNNHHEDSKSKGSLITAIIVAGLFWTLYTLFIDDFVSSDLRLISSYISEQLLGFFGLSVERNGTVLFGNGMRFEVIGACSGSTILKVMLGAGLFLSLSWQGLTKLNRVIAVILSATLAILSNALRVSLLVILSLHRGSPVGEGFLHDATGIATFILCFLTFCLICKKLSRPIKNIDEKSTKSSQSSISLLVKSLALTAILILLYLPFIKDIISSWIGTAWDSSNHFGYIFYFSPLLLVCYQTFKYHRTESIYASNKATVYILIVIALLLPVLSATIDVKALSGLGIIILLASCIMRYSGVRNAVLVSPLLMLSILGFPRIVLRIENLAPDRLPLSSQGLRFFIFISFIIIQVAISKLVLSRYKKAKVDKKSNTTHTYYGRFTLYFAILSLTLSLLIPDIIKPGSPNETHTFTRNNLELPYLLKGGWIGKDLDISNSDAEYFGIENIVYREYINSKNSSQSSNKGSHPVELLITFSGGDRHKNHPPEFCQSGSGWAISSKSEQRVSGDHSRKVVLLDLEKSDLAGKPEEKYMVYFFSAEGEFEETNFSKMMLGDITSRISGDKPNWLVIRLFSKSKSSILDFANKIPFPLEFNNTKKVSK